MPYLRDTVFVLKKEPYREHDRRYTMYGREHGLLVAVARGSSLRKSKQAGHLEPLSISDVMIAKGAAFDSLAVARSHRVSWMPSVTSRLAHYAVAGAFAGLTAELLRPGMIDERIFDLLHEVCSTTGSLPTEPSRERSRLLFSAATLKLLDALGYAPDIDAAREGTSPVPSLSLVSFMRRSALSDVLRVTASTAVLDAASAFVEEALSQAPLREEPAVLRSVVGIMG